MAAPDASNLVLIGRTDFACVLSRLATARCEYAPSIILGVPPALPGWQ